MSHAKTIPMGEPKMVEVKGCAVQCDGEVCDNYSSKTLTARAGWRVWTLSADQMATVRKSLAGIGDTANPMRGFHR